MNEKFYRISVCLINGSGNKHISLGPLNEGGHGQIISSSKLEIHSLNANIIDESISWFGSYEEDNSSLYDYIYSKELRVLEYLKEKYQCIT